MDVFFFFVGIYIFCFSYALLAVQHRVASTSSELTWCNHTMVLCTMLAVLVEDVLLFYILFEVLLLVMYVTVAQY